MRLGSKGEAYGNVQAPQSPQVRYDPSRKFPDFEAPRRNEPHPSADLDDDVLSRSMDPKSTQQLLQDRYKRDLPKRPKLGLENEWAAVAIRKDEVDRLEREAELEAEKAKKLLYRDELDAQKKLILMKKQLFVDKEKEKELQLLARQSETILEEVKQERRDQVVAKQIQSHCVNTSLKERMKRIKEHKLIEAREKARFNDEVEKNMKAAQTIEQKQDESKKLVTDSLKEIYEHQEKVSTVHEIQ
jgi:hypothetical protein